jgi:predicted MFS family arabinose efflux permease
MKAGRAADLKFLASGIVLLAVAMGVGRFAYTPLLPVMEHDAGLRVASAGTLAFANLFGYLAGAALALHPLTHRKRLAITRWSIVAIVVTTGLMATPAPFWLPLRFLTGVASGFVLIFSSSIVLERAAHAGRPSWPPLFFSGVGLGIAFSGIAVPLFVAHGGSRVAWAGIAVVCAAALAITLRWFVDDAPPASLAQRGTEVHLPRHRTTFAWLLAVYVAEAFAYVIPATFLVAIVDRIPVLAPFAPLAWVVVGLSGALATFAWIAVGARLGKARGLALALAIQAAGIAAPLAAKTPFTVAFAALALGGTFMAITLFAAGLGRDIFPHATSAAISRLTVLYSVGQMIGPLVATQLALHSGSYDSALLAASVAAAAAAMVTVVAIREPAIR